MKPMQRIKLFTEYKEHATALDTMEPRFSWIVDEAQAGDRQLHYRIIVRSGVGETERDVWDSGIVASEQPFCLWQAAGRLESDTDYEWTLAVHTHSGSVYSGTAKFSTGLLKLKDWTADWIGRGRGEVLKWDDNASGQRIKDLLALAKPQVETPSRSFLLRKEVTLHKSPRRAVVYVCGLGLYEMALNGRKVGDRVLSPLQSEYHKQIFYDTYDVTALLKSGPNALGIQLGNGWFSPPAKYWGWKMQWHGSPRAIVQMHIAYEDGTTQVVQTDASWKLSEGPVLHNCIYDGETYDARLEPAGWDLPGYDDRHWAFAKTVEPPCDKYVSNMYTPLKVIERIAPVARHTPQEGVLVYDFGQNVPGWVHLSVRGARGCRVTMRHAEHMDDRQMLDPTSNRNAENTDVYILRGEGLESYAPKFTYHGFQFLEITADPALPEIVSVEACVVHSAVASHGRLQVDNNELTKLHHAIRWTQRGALMGVPVDCPQRDERLGWLGDAHITAEVCLHNFDMSLFYLKWLQDIQTQQNKETGDVPHVAPRAGTSGSADWSSAYSLIVWYCYIHYGDERIIRTHYNHLKHYAQFLEQTGTGHIQPRSRYGDWLSPVEDWKRGDPEETNTLYYYANVLNLYKMACVLGYAQDRAYYEKLCRDIKKAINDAYYDAEKKLYGTGSQFSNAFALLLELVPEGDAPAVLDRLVSDIMEAGNGHLATGILGTKYVIDVLTLYEKHDIVYHLLKQKDYPSWQYMLEGRTTLPEQWDRKGSGNHCMFGSVDLWLYKGLAGICSDERHPGFAAFSIKPYVPAQLPGASAVIDTVRGPIKSAWTISADTFTWRVQVPFGSVAELRLPFESPRIKEIRVNGTLLWTGGAFVGTVAQVVPTASPGERMAMRVDGGRYEWVVSLW